MHDADAVFLFILYVGSLMAQSHGSCILPGQVDLQKTVSENIPIGHEVFNFQMDLEGANLTLIPKTNRDSGYLVLNYTRMSGAKVTITTGKSLDLNLLNPEPLQPPDTSESLPCNFTDPPPYDLAPKESVEYVIHCTTDDAPTPSSPVIVFIADENDFAPRFHCAPYYTSVGEMTPRQATVFTLENLAYDPDVFGSITGYTLYDSGPFTLTGGASVGMVTLEQSLDYDFGLRSFAINITAQDTFPSLYNSTLLLISVEDEDDLTPTYTSLVHRISFPEESWRAINVSRSTDPPVLAFDQDKGINASIAYRITLGADMDGDPAFGIDPSTGELFPLRVLDREMMAEFILLIEAYQIDKPITRASIAYVIVAVDDVNDNPPIISQTELNVTIQENLLEGSFVHKIHATDLDEKNNSVFHYRLYDNRGALKVDPLSGVVTVLDRTKLNREEYDTLQVNVIAEEVLTEERRISSNSTLEIKLYDVNDNSPACVPAPLSRYVSDSPLLPGQVLGRVFANDSDHGANGVVRYTLLYVDRQWSDWFIVDADDGTIFAQRELVVWDEDLLIAVMIDVEDQSVIISERRSTSCTVEIYIRASTTTVVPETTDIFATTTIEEKPTTDEEESSSIADSTLSGTTGSEYTKHTEAVDNTVSVTTETPGTTKPRTITGSPHTNDMSTVSGVKINVTGFTTINKVTDLPRTQTTTHMELDSASPENVSVWYITRETSTTGNGVPFTGSTLPRDNSSANHETTIHDDAVSNENVTIWPITSQSSTDKHGGMFTGTTMSRDHPTFSEKTPSSGTVGTVKTTSVNTVSTPVTSFLNDSVANVSAGLPSDLTTENHHSTLLNSASHPWTSTSTSTATSHGVKISRLTSHDISRDPSDGNSTLPNYSLDGDTDLSTRDYPPPPVTGEIDFNDGNSDGDIVLIVCLALLSALAVGLVAGLVVTLVKINQYKKFSRYAIYSRISENMISET